MTTPGARPTVVAIPARDEAQRIGACLAALLDQRNLDGRAIGGEHLGIVVVANNCRDATLDAVRGIGAGDRIRTLVLDLPSEQASAGTARRLAMETAAARLSGSRQGLICTTDADSRPHADWIARLWVAIDGGAQAVAGVVEFDPAEGELPRFSSARRREAAYAALQAEIGARIDPEPHNPWPNHLWAWGANLAVTSAAYRRVGGLAPEPLAEDRAFLRRLRAYDVPVRHALDARVWTSARRAGRAAGGLSSLVDDHAGADRAACDAALEPALDAYRRAAWRARLRWAHRRGRAPEGWEARLGLAPLQLRRALDSRGFGAAWSAIEAASPALRRRTLAPSELEPEIRRARRLLVAARRGAPDDPADSRLAAAASPWS